ncbi:hypothetical protein SLE2022_345860 [Rubroshorea leprosula]
MKPMRQRKSESNFLLMGKFSFFRCLLIMVLITSMLWMQMPQVKADSKVRKLGSKTAPGPPAPSSNPMKPNNPPNGSPLFGLRF